MRTVTERDLRMPEFADADPKDLEFRGDGKLVRKDRWEVGIRKIHFRLGMSCRDDFEIENVLIAVVSLVARCQLMDDAIGDVLWDEMRADPPALVKCVPILWPAVMWFRPVPWGAVPVPHEGWQPWRLPASPWRLPDTNKTTSTITASRSQQ